MELHTITGRTPLVRITQKVYAKLETYSPTGSVKDRLVTYLVSKAIKRGEINDATVMCEATSGNTGISLSAIAANLGLKCKIFMPSDMSEERRTMMRTFGATIVDAPPSDFSMAIEMRDEYVAKNKNVWTPNQFDNEENIECHQEITAPEILDDIRTHNLGDWSAFVHGAGTGGTIEGVRRFVHSKGMSTKTCMVIPKESPHGIQGIGDGKDFLAKQEDMDSTVIVKTQHAIARAKKFCKETGLLVGISAGANLVAAEQYEKDNPDANLIVTMLCDRGERYLTIF